MSETTPQGIEFEEMAKTDATVRAVVVRLMESTGLTQKEFARRWGVSEGMLSKLISGEQKDVSFEQVRKLVNGFGLNPRVFFPQVEPGNGPLP